MKEREGERGREAVGGAENDPAINYASARERCGEKKNGKNESGFTSAQWDGNFLNSNR